MDSKNVEQIIHIEYDENKDIYPPEKIIFRANKPMYVTVNVILLNEVERTMKMAVYDQKLDFNFYTQ